jgi:hypothetical protein
VPVATKLRDIALEDALGARYLTVPHRERPVADSRSGRALVDTPARTRLRPPPLCGLKQVVRFGRDVRHYANDDAEAATTSGSHTAVILKFPAAEREACLRTAMRASNSAAVVNIEGAEYQSPLSPQTRFRIIVLLATLPWIAILAVLWMLFG